MYYSRKSFHPPILRDPKENCILLSGGNVLKDRRQIYQACLQHYKPVSHGDSLNYESALDKFSSVCSFKKAPLSPSPKELGESGGEDHQPELKGMTATSLVHTCILGKVSGCGDQRTTPRIKAVKVCAQTREKEL